MIEQYFRRSHVRRRLELGPLASVGCDYVAHLAGRGYSTFTIQGYVQACEHFGRWLRRSEHTLERIDAAVVEEFYRQP